MIRFCQQTNPDTGACTKKVAVICPSNESEFTFTGCDENRCMLNPKLPSTTKDRCANIDAGLLPSLAEILLLRLQYRQKINL